MEEWVIAAIVGRLRADYKLNGFWVCYDRKVSIFGSANDFEAFLDQVEGDLIGRSRGLNVFA